MSKVSQFPGGFTHGVTIRGIPIQILHPGEVFYVSNSSTLAPGAIKGSNSNSGSYLAPFSTLDYAIGRCVEDRGDIIVLMPGHAENVSAVGGITVDVAGVAIVGLGAGTLRPKLSFTAATATYVISDHNVTHYNIQFEANFLDVATGLDISAVDGLNFVQCYFTDAGTNTNFIDVVDLATGADDITFDRCKFIGKDAQNDAFITGVAHSGFYVSDCMFSSTVAQATAVGLIEATGNVTNAWIKDSLFVSNMSATPLMIDFDGATCSGAVSNCYFSSLDAAGAVTAGFDFTGGHFFECYVSGEADAWGIVGGGTVYS